MTDRATPGDGSPACPFIAFEDERDERSSSPDHRHRCYAEVRPAPRAVAHQEAYCLSSAFPVCPTFQDWARREAAKAKSPGRGDAAATPRGAAPRPAEALVPVMPDLTSDPASDDEIEDDLWSAPHTDDEPIIHRNPPRDWAAPPPWASGAGGSPRTGADDRHQGAPPAPRPPGAGLAGSAADRMAGGLPSASSDPATASPASDDLAALVAPPKRSASPPPPAPISRPPTGHYPTTSAAGRRPSVSSTRERERPAEHDGPSWERAKRYEAYPTIKTRAGLPGIPRLALWAGALAVAALALFFAPGFFSGDGAVGPGASATPSATSASPTVAPTVTPVPSPTPELYVIKKGDTLSKIAKKFGVTVDQIIDANKETIKDPNRIKVGDEIVIPLPLPDEIVDPSAETTESPEPS